MEAYRSAVSPVFGELEDGYTVEPSNSYLVKEESPENSVGIFADLLSRGYRGLCLTRNNPERLRRRFNLGGARIYWMTDIDTEDRHVKPDIDSIRRLVLSYLSRVGSAVVLIMRLDYLIYRNGYEAVLSFLNSLRDRIMLCDCVLLVSANHYVLEEKELRMLDQELLSPYRRSAESVLREPLYNILEYIYKQNLARRPVAFKDISSRFCICKNTTGRRVNELEGERLVELRKNGRYKLLFVTPRGRDMVGPQTNPGLF